MLATTERMEEIPFRRQMFHLVRMLRKPIHHKLLRIRKDRHVHMRSAYIPKHALALLDGYRRPIAESQTKVASGQACRMQACEPHDLHDCRRQQLESWIVQPVGTSLE